MRNFVYSGIQFTPNVYPVSGSFLITDNPERQAFIESSRAFELGMIRLEDAPEKPAKPAGVKPPKPLDNTEPNLDSTVFPTDSLQQARDIIYAIMEKRNIERTACPNRKAIIAAAERLGITFPNL